MGSFAEPSNMLSTLATAQTEVAPYHISVMKASIQPASNQNAPGRWQEREKKKHEVSEAVALRNQPQQETQNVLHNEVLTEADCTAAVAMSL